MTRPRPIDRERPFALDELFISTTDRKGIIRLSNRVFVRISGYEGDELVGRPHNVVRHPDMPRAVFRVFWDFLGDDRPIAAYVKNLARDGAYYWVMAIAVPAGDGYLSVRLKPTSPLFETAQAIYAEVRAVEERVEAGDPRNRKRAIEAGVERLGELLTAAGFDSYESFMRAALVAEVTSRETQLGDSGTRAEPSDPRLAAILDAADGANRFLHGMVGDLARYSELSEQLADKSRFVRELAAEVRLFSINALLAAARLADGATLAAVAGLMRARSDAAAPAIGALGEDIDGALTLLRDMGFRIAAGKLQTEMIGEFVTELAEDGGEAIAQLDLLAGALEDAVDRLSEAREALDARLVAVSSHAGHVRRHLNVFRALEVNGRVEAARAADAADVRELFRSIGDQVGEARSQIESFGGVDALQSSGTVEQARRHVAAVRAALA